MIRTALALALALAAGTILASSTLAQHSGGPFTGVAAGIRVDNNTFDSGGVQVPAGVLLSKKTGFVAVGDAGAPPVAGDPDFRFAQILQGLLNIRVNAMSIGLDAIHAETTGPNIGVANPVQGAWVGLLFTVQRSSPGASGVVATEQGRADGAAADIFSFVLRESTPCAPDPAPCGIVGQTERVFDSSELGLWDGTNQGNITALDAHIGLYRLGAELLSTTTTVQGCPIALPAEPTFFFTVTRGTRSNVPMAWWGGLLPSSATILCTTWSAAAGSWSTPQPFMSRRTLGLQLNDAIDGLAVDTKQNVLLFSTDDPMRTQIEFAGFPMWDGTTKPVPPGLVTTADYRSLSTACPPTDPGTTSDKVADQTGGGGAIGDFCEFDPGYVLQSGDLPVGRDAWLIGTACEPASFFQAVLGPPSPELDASVLRGHNGFSSTIEPYLVGWGAGGPADPGTGFLFVRIDVRVGTNWIGTWADAPLIVPRTAASGEGGPTGLPIPIPAPLVPLGVDSRVGFQWVACDGMGCGLAHEVTIMLADLP